MMRKKLTKAEVALFAVPAAVLLLMALVGRNPQLSRRMSPFFTVFQRDALARRDDCQGNLKNIWLATAMYVQDYDEFYPPKGYIGYKGSSAVIEPYLLHAEYFHCPALPANRALTSTDYWLNANLLGLKDSTVVHPLQTFLLGDGTATSGKNYSLNSFPKDWRENSDSPMNRHLDGANYVFTDGHAKWFYPDEAMKLGGKRGAFVIR